MDDGKYFNYICAFRRLLPAWGSLCRASYLVWLIVTSASRFLLIGRLGMSTSYVMLGGQKAFEALGNAWENSDVHGVRLFFLCLFFLGVQLLFGLVGGLIIQEENVIFIVLTTIVKYITTIPLTYLFYSLYKSLNPSSY